MHDVGLHIAHPCEELYSMISVCVAVEGWVFIKMNFTGLLTGDMLEVDEFQFSTNDQLLHEVKNKAKLPNTCYPLLTFLNLAPSSHTPTHTHKRTPTLTHTHAHIHTCI